MSTLSQKSTAKASLIFLVGPAEQQRLDLTSKPDPQKSKNDNLLAKNCLPDDDILPLDPPVCHQNDENVECIVQNAYFCIDNGFKNLDMTDSKGPFWRPPGQSLN